MRRCTQIASGIMLASISIPLAAQDMPPGPIPQTETEMGVPEAPPPLDMPPVMFSMTPEQSATYDSWQPQQRALYANWPNDVQAYYWSLPEPRQQVFWRLSESDRLALTAMSAAEQDATWQMVESRIAEENPPAAGGDGDQIEDEEGLPR